MLKIENTYDDRDAIVTARHVQSGADGQSTTLGPGESATIEIDGDFSVAIGTRGRNPGELPIQMPVATKVGADAGDESTLTDADDDVVRAEIQDMVTNNVSLTQAGPPQLEALNERLAAKGYNPINAKRRSDLMPVPA